MKAWHVMDKTGENEEIVFAEKRSDAIGKSEAYSSTGNWIDVRATRAKYADGLEKASEDKFLQVLISEGWWFECSDCSRRVIEEDNPLIKAGRIYCEKCQEGATNER